jgi:acyl-coenzyme A thioesterase PaaI-like protein
VSVRHHELCFGCGQQNLFGLQIELEPREGGGVAGRFFVKQDHQGPPGVGHGGVIAAALDEAMGLAIHAGGTLAYMVQLEVELHAPAPVGSFVELEAKVVGEDGRRLAAEARASAGDEELATATGTFVRQP